MSIVEMAQETELLQRTLAGLGARFQDAYLEVLAGRRVRKAAPAPGSNP